MSRTREAPVRTAATAALILVAAAALALRPAVVAGHPLSPSDRAWLLAALYLAIGAASLLPPMSRDHASFSSFPGEGNSTGFPPRTFFVGSSNVSRSR